MIGGIAWADIVIFAVLAVTTYRGYVRGFINELAGIVALIAGLVVPWYYNGILDTPIHQITGESEFNEVFIEDARVPAENLVGELNAGWSVLQTALAYERRFMADMPAPPKTPSGRETRRVTCWSSWRAKQDDWTIPIFGSRSPASTPWPRSTGGTPSGRRLQPIAWSRPR